MFRPVGSQPPAVYWRRRLVLLATIFVVLILLVVSARVLFGNDGSSAPPAGQGSTTKLSSTPPPSTSSSRTSPSTTSSSAPASTSTSRTVATPQPCASGALTVQAVADHASYQVGDKPKVMLQVTNSGSVSCTQDLADPKIELTVYNGESRVWGSHDCMILHGTNLVTLVPNAPVRVTIVWSGLSSKANTAHTASACGPRQRVGAGTYTLYAKLGAKTGKAAQFSIG